MMMMMMMMTVTRGAKMTATIPTATRMPAKAPAARIACRTRTDNNFITYNNRLPRTARIMTAGASRMTDAAAAAGAAAIRSGQTRGVPYRW